MAFAYQLMGAGVETLAKNTVKEVEPDDNQVKIRVMASSINYHDYVTLIGLIPTLKFPLVPMSDGCGEVVSVGKSVDRFKVGDRVLPMFYPEWISGRPDPSKKRDILGETIDGCLQEFLCVDQDKAVLAPGHMSDAQAATLVCAGLTAWYPLMEENRLTDDHIVLLQGTGGVSLAALQIAKAIGAKVVITSSSDEKLAQAKSLGADYLINYKSHPYWEQEVIRLCGPVDITLDTGGPGTLGKATQCTKHDGFIAVIGILTGIDMAPISVIDVMQKNITIKGITVGCSESFERLCRFTEEHAIEPVISHTIDASEMAKGIELLSSGSHFGKISVNVN